MVKVYASSIIDAPPRREGDDLEAFRKRGRYFERLLADAPRTAENRDALQVLGSLPPLCTCAEVRP